MGGGRLGEEQNFCWLYQLLLALIIPSLPSVRSLARSQAVSSPQTWVPCVGCNHGAVYSPNATRRESRASPCAEQHLTPRSPCRWRSPCSAFRMGSAMPCTRPNRVWRTKSVASLAGRPSSLPWASGWTPQPVACRQPSSSQLPTLATGSSSAAAPSSPCWVSLGQGRAEGLTDTWAGGRGPCTQEDTGSELGRSDRVC